MPKMTEIFEKVTSPRLKSNFGGPAGGSALERASPPTGRGKIQKISFLYFIERVAAGSGGAGVFWRFEWVACRC